MPAGFSATHFDSATVERIDAFTVGAISASAQSGRAMSDRSHSAGPLRYVELELLARRSEPNWHWGVGFVDNTDNLADWIGLQSYQGVYQGVPNSTDHGVYASGANVTANVGGVGRLWPGSRIGLWLDPASRKVWVATHGDNSWRPQLRGGGDPTAGTGQAWTVPGTAALRFGVMPGFGSVGNRNIIRAYTQRASDWLVTDALGAQPWDARQVTVTGTVNTAHAAVGSTLRWAWFDHASPHQIVTSPTSVGTLTVGTGGAISATVWTSLDAGGVGSLLLMLDGGDVVAARSHYMPVAAP